MHDRTLARCSIVSLLASLLALSACEESIVRPPPPPDPDGAVIRPPPPPPRRDAGVLEFDAARPDASTGRDAEVSGGGCVRAGPLNDAMVTRDDGTEYPFEPTDVFVTWANMFCDDPTLVVGLSEAGCVAGAGPELLFLIREDAIDTRLITGEIDLGAATVDGDLRVLFRAGVSSWEACPGSAGVLTIESLGTLRGERLNMAFDLTLTDCSATEPPVQVDGRFSIVLDTALEEVCPR